MALGVETLRCNVSTREPTEPENEFFRKISPKKGSVPTIIRSFKAVCTRNLRLYCPAIDFGWQERFHEHIIRNAESYRKIETYIFHNARTWEEDKFYPTHP